MMSNTGGAVISGSIKQKLNVQSSTAAELVVADDFVDKIMWTAAFLKHQGYPVDRNVLYQDNKSAILLETKGRSSLGERNHALNIQYFFITDCVA